MGAITDLWKSERGLLCLAIIVASTVLVVQGTLSVDDWKQLIMVIFGTYVAGKTASSVAEIIKRPSLLAAGGNGNGPTEVQAPLTTIKPAGAP